METVVSVPGRRENSNVTGNNWGNFASAARKSSTGGHLFAQVRELLLDQRTARISACRSFSGPRRKSERWSVRHDPRCTRWGSGRLHLRAWMRKRPGGSSCGALHWLSGAGPV